MNANIYLGFILLIVSTFSLSSCTESEILIEQDSADLDIVRPQSRAITIGDTLSKSEAIESFAKILSKAVYQHQEVRQLLKNQALLYFDKNSDVLYALVKRINVDGKTFRDILLEYSSEQELSEIEATVPLLNILIPKLTMLDITAENMDCSDKEIPICVSKDEGMVLYINGKAETVVETGGLPAFHTFVVNENSRVYNVGIPSRGDLGNGISFISPNFDGRNDNVSPAKIEYYTPDYAGWRAIQAFTYFNGYEANEYSYTLQRDYIYYGMTPTSEKGTFNNGVTEYIMKMEINPKAYFNISDQVIGGEYTDPHLVKNSVTRFNHKMTEEELINEMWAKGAYNFRFEIIYSNSSQPTIIYIPLYPEDIWNFNIDKSVDSKLLILNKYVYKIDPKKFTAKGIFLDKKISLGKWDLSKEGTERYIRIFEEDKSQTYKETYEYEYTKMTTYKVNGSIKYGLGTDIVSGSVGGELTNTTTTRENKKYELTRQEEDDALGTIKVYFYDPIIEARVGLDRFILHEYNTGVVSFIITADYL